MDRDTQADLYVSPSGNDSWSGTITEQNADGTDGPLATLDEARLRLRELKKTQRRDYRVLIRGGIYNLGRPVIFQLEDAAAEERITTYEAYPGEEPVLSSGVEITGWRLSGDPNIPVESRGNVWEADLPESLGCIRSLAAGDMLLQRARSQLFFSQDNNVYGWDVESHPDTKKRGRLPKGALKTWANLGDIELGARSVNWTINLLSLATVDVETGAFETTIPATYSFNRGRKRHGSGEELPTLWIENALEYLSSPGEWVVNTKNRKVFLWPETGGEPMNIRAPSLSELIRVEGKIDKLGPEDMPVKGLVFRGLSFTLGERDIWTDHDAGIQHDWEMIDKGDSLIRFRGAEQCAVENCTFSASGGTAIRFDLHCMHCRAIGNHIHHMGQGGIMLIGYGPGTKDVNRYNGIINNHIHDCGIIYPHSHGIVMSQSGDNRIAHNYIHHMPRKAICLTGVRMHRFERRDSTTRECAKSIRWHEVGDVSTWWEVLPFLHTKNNLVEYNEVERCLQSLGDGSSVNISGAGMGNVIRRNYIHDIYGADGEWVCACVRTDDWQRGTLITENVIARSSTSAFEHKCENRFINNVIVDVNPQYIIRFGRHWGPFEKSAFYKNIFINSAGTCSFYWPPKDLREMTTCEIDNNIYFVADGSAAGKDLTELKSYGFDLKSLTTNPFLADYQNGDFRLTPESPAHDLGIVSVDVRYAGLLNTRGDLNE